MKIDRRTVLFGLPLFAGGCVSGNFPAPPNPRLAAQPQYSPEMVAMYAAIDTEPFPVPAIDLRQVDPKFLRAEVAYDSPHPVGTIVVDPYARYLYLVRERGRALRYGVGVGKVDAFNFTGEATIARKAAWPSWRPTNDMIAREPDRYGPLSEGLPGGLTNPLGARALYLYRDGKDTYYRIHGTLEPWTIGTKVSSGCIRLLNQDIIDLHRRTPVGSKVIVLTASDAVA
ncbi:L,D-transpeptidase [Methylobrevis pamukkalensis]|uniref:Putative L,D-transpeptidase YbiS n=1 Tax=Methylobrevis pamukkalensis TaxID=1439726 RepID=A0A1E3H429_9HYPH|nr:L,D-transpeptidase [Methylobrevis pamukkalensis]ODN71107.1 putative L,D-transpeptidase YbiS precursor [Methylobrevis pamukkalensis]